jgi:hypothetical protein
VQTGCSEPLQSSTLICVTLHAQHTFRQILVIFRSLSKLLMKAAVLRSVSSSLGKGVFPRQCAQCPVAKAISSCCVVCSCRGLIPLRRNVSKLTAGYAETAPRELENYAKINFSCWPHFFLQVKTPHEQPVSYIYRTMLEPIWTCGTQLWGTASTSNIEI